MSGGGGGGEAPEEAGGFASHNVFGEPAEAGVDLNLTALMDILSNLLFFLLASFGATIVMAINTTVPTQSAEASDVAKTENAVTVSLNLSKTKLSIAAAGDAYSPAELSQYAKAIAYNGDAPDFAALNEHLYKIKERFPKSDTMILTPEAGIRYETLIKVMDAARERDVTVEGNKQTVTMFPSVVVSTIVK